MSWYKPATSAPIQINVELRTFETNEAFVVRPVPQIRIEDMSLENATYISLANDATPSPASSFEDIASSLSTTTSTTAHRPIGFVRAE